MRLKRVIHPCENGGQINLFGLCKCPANFYGAHCELVVCRHGGVQLAKATQNGTRCACADPHFVGWYCEQINCENKGVPYPGDVGACDCTGAGGYHGRFCEKPDVPWDTVFWCVLAGIMVCSLIWFIYQLVQQNRHKKKIRKLTVAHQWRATGALSLMPLQQHHETPGTSGDAGQFLSQRLDGSIDVQQMQRK